MGRGKRQLPNSLASVPTKRRTGSFQPRAQRKRTQTHGFVPDFLSRNLVSFQKGTKALESLLESSNVFASKEERRDSKISAAIRQVSKELAQAAEATFDGEFRTCFQINDWIYKVPNPDKNDPCGTIGAQFTEAAAIETGFQDEYAGLSLAEGYLFFHKSGIPIIAMEKLNTDAKDFQAPDWLQTSRTGSSEEKRQLASEPGYDPEIHQQVGFSSRSESLVFFDLGCVPCDRPNREEEFEKSDFYWPGKTKSWAIPS